MPAPTTTLALRRLRSLADPRAAAFLQGYFKTGPGEYGEGDVFLGIKVPVLRALAKELRAMPIKHAERLLQQELHEARTLALMILVLQYQSGTPAERQAIYRLYLRNLDFINNWDLIDGSAAQIVGAHLHGKDLTLIEKLARSKKWNERRVAVIATAHYIGKREFDATLLLAERLLGDTHDLMHKAVGWMLREIGKRDIAPLRKFLDKHAAVMPRTMLRYAIERLPPAERARYMSARARKNAGNS